jgi:hypothetical protein
MRVDSIEDRERIWIALRLRRNRPIERRGDASPGRRIGSLRKPKSVSPWLAPPRPRRASRCPLGHDSAVGWEADLETKHGMPLDEIRGHVYVLHYDQPQIVKSVSGDYAGSAPRADADGWLSATAIRHYVGWTQQRLPRKRINRHGPAALREIVYLQPGTTRDEQLMKASGTCPKCGEALAASLAERPR